MKNKVVRVDFWLLLGLILCLQGCRFDAKNTKNSLNEAEELYHQGISYNNSSQYESSTAYLKQAEEILVSLPRSSHRDRLLGLTWFCLGNTSESDMLYDIAQNYYRKSIPLLDPDSNTIYLACAYRDIARTKQLAQDYNVPTRYSEIVELLLAQHATDSAAYYLERLQPTDSAYAYWFEQSYAYLNSKILRQRGKADTAYGVLLDLYDRKIEELQRDAGARTYALSLHYDVAREQQRAQEAQREKQWQRKISLVLVLLLTVLIVLFVVLWRYWQQRRREQSRQLEALRDKYVQQLQLALERLQQKVNLTREIEMQRMRGNEVEFPKWLQTYRDEQLTMSKESLDELIASIDKALDGAISRLRSEYPELTESDMQFAILSIIGASDNDMSIVLNVQKQTIYHRRQIVRKHVNAEIDDIDSWLRQYVLSVF